MTPDSHAQRKAKVYEAALALTSQGVSPAAMTIQQLADAAGIGKGTVYEYFLERRDFAGRGPLLLCAGERAHRRPV